MQAKTIPADLRVLLLPALGTDQALYDALRAALAELRRRPGSTAVSALQYGPSRRGEDLRTYVRRQFSEQFNGPGEFDLVIGTSLGGMAAQELIAGGLVQTDRLILISSCFSGRELGWLLRCIAPLFVLLPYIPRVIRRALIQIVAVLFPIVRRNVADGPALTAMIRRADPDFLFASGVMISRWRKNESPLPLAAGLAPATFHIQGHRDPILSYNRILRVREPEVTVPKGDHIMILTRASELAGYIQSAGYWP